MSELTPDEIDGDATDLIADGATISSRYALAQIVSAKLWRDEGMRASYVRHLLLQPTPGYERTDDEHREAASFGRYVHDHPTEKPEDWPDECGEGCAIWPCAEADAQVVMMRLEVNVRKVDDEQ